MSPTLWWRRQAARNVEEAGPWHRWALGVGALLRAPGGDIALVEAEVVPGWRELRLPGGGIGPGESPEEALRRTVREATGLERAAGRLLVIEWARAVPEREQPAGGNWLFDVTPLSDHESLLGPLVAPEDIAPRAPQQIRRIDAALRALNTGDVAYLRASH